MSVPYLLLCDGPEFLLAWFCDTGINCGNFSRFYEIRNKFSESINYPSWEVREGKIKLTTFHNLPMTLAIIPKAARNPDKSY
jgi:hypothetical protein